MARRRLIAIAAAVRALMLGAGGLRYYSPTRDSAKFADGAARREGRRDLFGHAGFLGAGTQSRERLRSRAAGTVCRRWRRSGPRTIAQTVDIVNNAVRCPRQVHATASSGRPRFGSDVIGLPCPTFRCRRR